MRSRADVRRTIELTLRAMSLGILVWLLLLSLDRGGPPPRVSTGSGKLAGALIDWTTLDRSPPAIAVHLDSAPSPVERDWLAAFRAAGSEVTWNGDLPALAISARAIASPHGGVNVVVGAPAGASVELRDEVGPIDTVEARSGGARFVLPNLTGEVAARVAGTAGRTWQRDSAHVRRLLVIGAAGWESKFVITALEEDGWKVDAWIHVAPGVSVTQGAITPIDTSRFSAVIMLDPSAALYAQRITEYVGRGGGLIIAGPGASVEAITPLRVAATGRTSADAMLASDDGVTTLRSLPLAPLIGLRADAVVLDRRGGAISVAARRYGNGRVLQHGYADTWRWRLSGDDESLENHRAWWTASVAAVAYAPREVLPLAAAPDDAPVASLVETLGARSDRPAASLAAAASSVSLWWLFILLSVSLMAEWASRRLRGSG